MKSKKLAIGNRLIGDNCPVYIIAEIGMNHNGDFNLAKKMIQTAAECGVDGVKFQTFKTENFYSKDYPDYNERKKFELPYDWHFKLKEVADHKGVEFISTPLDFGSADFLETLGVNCFKIASLDVNNEPFLEYVAKKNKPILLSTGYSNIEEVKEAVKIINNVNKQLVLLHCVSMYPTPVEKLNLKSIVNLNEMFDCIVGFSDHSVDLPISSVIATTLGAKIIEKHFTIDRNLPGYDHKISDTPESLKQLVNYVRNSEKALGAGRKEPTKEEEEKKIFARRSLYWKNSFEKGTLINSNMVDVLRPSKGLSPGDLKNLTGKFLKESVKEGSLVDYSQIDWRGNE